MGIYNEGILGFFRGKIGRVIGSVVRGVHYMKGLGDVRTDNPSRPQLDQRAKWSLVMGFIKPLKRLIDVGFPVGKTGLTSMNKATSANLNEMITGVSPTFALDYSKFVYSKGGLPKPTGLSVETADGSNLIFKWENAGANAGTDLATVLVYNPEKDTYVMLPGAAPRSALSYTLQLPLNFGGDMVHMWISFVAANGKEVSNSEYIGGMEVF